MRFFLSLAFIFTSLTAHAADYCAAIRGNGENVAAHWAGLSRMVEENGLPRLMAGGSSATITMFFVDQIAGNPVIKNETNEVLKRKKAGLLLKSLGEFLSEMARTDQAMSAYALMGDLSKKDSDISARLNDLLKNKDKFSSEAVAQAAKKYFPLINPELVRGLMSRPDFFVPEVKKAMAVFGKFDAVHNDNLFVRPGMVDFKEFAVSLGNIADFYRGNTDAETKNDLNGFLNACAEKLYRKQWETADDDCVKRFQRTVDNYLRAGDFQNIALFQPIGENIESIPTTSLLTGPAIARYQDFRRSYMSGDDKKDYASFAVNFADEVQFGYWTSQGEKIRGGLATFADKGDLKSQKFTALEANNWFEVLATSPAEPGLASVQMIPVHSDREQVLSERQKPVQDRWNGLQYKKDAVSAGGWSDLHPTAVLKAAGCERVAYFTRIDGETVFGQQVFIRLTGAQKEVPFWQSIDTQNNSGWKVSGDTESSPWNRLYNAGNPGSSFNRALQAADIVYCTNWNRFEPFKGQMKEMEKQSYAAPVFLKPGIAKSFQVNRPSSPPTFAEFPGCVPL